MRFEGKRDPFFFYIWLSILVPFSVVTTLSFYSGDQGYSVFFIFGGIWIGLGGLFYVIIRSTHYTFVDEETLMCQTMYFFKKKIKIQSIRKFEQTNGFYAGFKMSTSWKCLIMHYNKHEELLISPENEELFIQEVDRRKSLINP